VSRFTHYVDVPPMQCLARWRLQLAARLLARPGGSVSGREVAEQRCDLRFEFGTDRPGWQLDEAETTGQLRIAGDGIACRLDTKAHHGDAQLIREIVKLGQDTALVAERARQQVVHLIEYDDANNLW
jgi:hypothetical protein